VAFALAVLGAVAAAVCYGVASVLQAVAARRSTATAGVDPRVLLRLMRQVPYLGGIGLDLLGFLGSVAALHRLPLFFVQAAIASSVGVTVLLAMAFLGVRVRALETAALVGLGVGLLLLALAARPEAATSLPRAGEWAVLGGVAVVAGFGVFAGRPDRARGGVALALGSGLAFSGVGIAARSLVVPHPGYRLIAEPLAWAIAGYGLLATLLFAAALQRGSVTTTAALTSAVDTVVPAAVGLTCLGDTARSGFAPVAGVGFVLAVASAIALARHARPLAALPVPNDRL
jgi:drug/metabolite transporter (DMT)-like permease